MTDWLYISVGIAAMAGAVYWWAARPIEQLEASPAKPDPKKGDATAPAAKNADAKNAPNLEAPPAKAEPINAAPPAKANAAEPEPAAAKPEQKPERAKAGPTAETVRPASSAVEPATPSPKKAEPVKAALAKSAAAQAAPVPMSDLPSVDYDAEDADVEPTNVGECATKSMVVKKIVYDEDAAMDEPTHAGALILVTATAQTDAGLRRKRNEDSVLVLEEHGLFVVADGMGGYRGGEIASNLAVTTMEQVFKTQKFGPPRDKSIPPRASELASAIQAANDAILSRAEADRQFEGMGTTICAARFSSNKQRLYVGHVGDSRVYCLRDGALRQMTSDHTMADLGVTGPGANHLSRAVGVWPTVPVDIILGKPRAGDVYLLCSDGLTKMVKDVAIERILLENEPQPAAEKLIEAAKQHGGKDNITVVVVWVTEPHLAPKSKPPKDQSSSAA